MKRNDGRDQKELRPIEAKVGVIKNADGSAIFKIGNTVAYAAVYGPKDLFPKFKQNPEGGILRVNYNMLPFSGAGDRVRPGGSRRSKEINLVIENALTPVLDLTNYPNAVVDVFIELSQTDAGTRCAGVCAAAMALADAGIVMKDMVAAVAVGKVDNQMIVDLNYIEDSDEDGADLPIGMTCNGKKITLLQMDGRLSKENVLDGIELAKDAIDKIYEIQKRALKEKYQGA